MRNFAAAYAVPRRRSTDEARESGVEDRSGTCADGREAGAFGRSGPEAAIDGATLRVMSLAASQGGIEGRENSEGRRRKASREDTTRAEAYASTATKRARRRRGHDDVGRLLLVGDAEGPAGAAGRAGVGRVDFACCEPRVTIDE